MLQTSKSITVGNPWQDAEQNDNLADAFSTTNPLEFMAVEVPSSWDQPTTEGESLVEKQKQRHLFGNHIREAVAIVRDWVKDR